MAVQTATRRRRYTPAVANLIDGPSAKKRRKRSVVSFLSEVMRLEQLASRLRRKWTTIDARWPDAIGGAFELLAAVAVRI